MDLDVHLIQRHGIALHKAWELSAIRGRPGRPAWSGSRRSISVRRKDQPAQAAGVQQLNLLAIPHVGLAGTFGIRGVRGRLLALPGVDQQDLKQVQVHPRQRPLSTSQARPCHRLQLLRATSRPGGSYSWLVPKWSAASSASHRGYPEADPGSRLATVDQPATCGA